MDVGYMSWRVQGKGCRGLGLEFEGLGKWMWGYGVEVSGQRV